jgi:hypothetical protein
MFWDVIKVLRAVFAGVAGILSGRPDSYEESESGSGDGALIEKLKDVRFGQHEDESTAQRQAAPEGGDDLAATVYRARPQNPLSDDF